MLSILSLITVFMGSMLAYKEKVLKKRLAYSTVSQASYILFGLSLLQPAAMTGALLHKLGIQGDQGGHIVAVGTPEQVAQVPGSYTGEFLQKVLK